MVGREFQTQCREEKAFGVEGAVAGAALGHAAEFLAQMSLYQHHRDFPSGLSVAKSGAVWQLPWKPDSNQLLAHHNFNEALSPCFIFINNFIIVDNAILCKQKRFGSA